MQLLCNVLITALPQSTAEVSRLNNNGNKPRNRLTLEEIFKSSETFPRDFEVNPPLQAIEGT